VRDEHVVLRRAQVAVSADDDEGVDRARVALERAVRLEPQPRPRGHRPSAGEEQANIVAGAGAVG
jgi:hypothetical protein